MTVDTMPDSDATRARILSAFQGPRDAWRTADGVARQTCLSLTAVTEFLEAHPELFVRSPIRPAGMTVYGFRDRLPPDEAEELDEA